MSEQPFDFTMQYTRHRESDYVTVDVTPFSHGSLKTIQMKNTAVAEVLIYQISRRYDALEREAMILIAVGSRNPVGYSLLAFVFKQRGQFEKALKYYDQAIKLTEKSNPEITELYAQRCEVLTESAKVNFLEHHVEKVSCASGRGHICPVIASQAQEALLKLLDTSICNLRALQD